MTTSWQRVARAQHGQNYAEAYAERFRTLSAEGHDIHGEAHLVEAVLPPPARILDAGCGTGRIAARLAARGYDVVGCDLDEQMIGVAHRDHPGLAWHVADLAHLDDAGLGNSFDLVLLAGNVIPFLEPDTLDQVGASIAGQLRTNGLAIAGFGLDHHHLPAGCSPVLLHEVDNAMTRAGLALEDHWATWDRAPYKGGGYVAAYRKPPPPPG